MKNPIKIHAVLSVYTGILHGNFNDMHEYIEHLLGRPVFTHELANKDLMDKIKIASKSDFLKAIIQIKDLELK